MQANFHGFTFVDERTMDEQFGGRSYRSNAGHGDKMDQDNSDDEDSDDAFGERAYNGRSGITGKPGTGKTGDDDSMFNTGNFDM